MPTYHKIRPDKTALKTIGEFETCPCGSAYFTRNYQAKGTWEQTIQIKATGRIEIVESFTDGLRHGKEPKTISCATCGRRAANPNAQP